MIKVLKDAVKYSNKRVSLEQVNFENYITTDNLLQNKQGKTNVENLPPNLGNVSAYEKGDILISNKRPYLKKIWFAKHSGGSSADVLIMNVGQGFDSKFIYYSLFRDVFFEHMMNGSKGTKMPRGDKNQILDFPIPNFHIQTQKSIAKVLSDLDAKIELNNKINKELEAMAKTLYDYWFVQFDFPFDFAQGKPNEKGKPFKTSGGKMVYNKELKREIPEGWEVKKLESICEKIQSGGTPISTNKLYYNGDINWFTTKELQDDWLLNSENKISKSAITESSTKLFPRGTVTIAIYASPTVGRVSILSKESAFNQACCGLVANNKYISKEYLFLTLILYRKKLNIMATGTTQKNLGVGTIKTQKVLVPPNYIINLFNEIVIPTFSRKEILIKENQQLSQLRDWLLPMLMNGQVSIKSNKNQENQDLNIAAESSVEYQSKRKK